MLQHCLIVTLHANTYDVQVTNEMMGNLKYVRSRKVFITFMISIVVMINLPIGLFNW